MGFNTREFHLPHELAMYGITAVAVLVIVFAAAGLVRFLRFFLRRLRP